MDLAVGYPHNPDLLKLLPALHLNHCIPQCGLKLSLVLFFIVNSNKPLFIPYTAVLI